MGAINQEEFMQRVTDLKADEYTLLHEAWALSEKERIDGQRNAEILENHIFGGTVFYRVPNHKAWILLSHVAHGLNGNVQVLSLDDTVEKGNFKETAKEMMRDYDLRRVTTYVPAPVARMQHRLSKVGFEQEGRLKDAGRYDEKYTDVLIYGFYRSEVEDSKVALSSAAKGKTARKRQRRSRRKKQTENSGESKTET